MTATTTTTSSSSNSKRLAKVSDTTGDGGAALHNGVAEGGMLRKRKSNFDDLQLDLARIRAKVARGELNQVGTGHPPVIQSDTLSEPADVATARTVNKSTPSTEEEDFFLTAFSHHQDRNAKAAQDAPT